MTEIKTIHMYQEEDGAICIDEKAFDDIATVCANEFINEMIETTVRGDKPTEFETQMLKLAAGHVALAFSILNGALFHTEEFAKNCQSRMEKDVGGLA